jgi:zinc protease
VEIPYSQCFLDNGLRVIVHESRSLPIVAVNLWYHVGSKNEQPGRTGFAHLFEHLMFEGSKHYDRGYFHPLQEAGATLNGSTNADRTNYWEVVPTPALELALWMESDRMGYLLPALTQEKFQNQLDVVLNERRQNYENRPYGMAGMALVAALYPSDHPYHWMTIGAAEDLQAANLEDVQAFFRRYYHPRNASLVLAGDIHRDDGVALARKYFDEISDGPAGERVVRAASLNDESRIVLEDRVELPRVYIAWHSPAMFASGDAEMDLIADLLANGKSSRLYRILVYERRIATDLGAAQNSREMAGWCQISATASPGHSLSELFEVIESELARFLQSGPTEAEIERGLAQAEAHFMGRLQTLGGFGGKSDQLNAYAVFLDDPGYLARDLQRYRGATPATLLDTARQVLGSKGRVILSVVPSGRRDLAVSGSHPVEVS